MAKKRMIMIPYIPCEKFIYKNFKKHLSLFVDYRFILKDLILQGSIVKTEPNRFIVSDIVFQNLITLETGKLPDGYPLNICDIKYVNVHKGYNVNEYLIGKYGFEFTKLQKNTD